MNLAELMDSFDETYNLDELPDHPSWCARAGEAREVCAVGRPGGPYSSVEHASSIDFRMRGTAYLQRSDLKGLGIGPVMIGLVGIGTDEELAWEPAEARGIALELLAAADAAERYEAASQ